MHILLEIYSVGCSVGAISDRRVYTTGTTLSMHTLQQSAQYQNNIQYMYLLYLPLIRGIRKYKERRTQFCCRWDRSTPPPPHIANTATMATALSLSVCQVEALHILAGGWWSSQR
jgi:hypothetical protein